MGTWSRVGEELTGPEVSRKRAPGSASRVGGRWEEEDIGEMGGDTYKGARNHWELTETVIYVVENKGLTSSDVF